MKKVLFVLSLILVISLAACGKKQPEAEAPVETTAAAAVKETEAKQEATAPSEPETVEITAPDGSTMIVEVDPNATVEAIDPSNLPRGYAGEDAGLTSGKWKETTQNIATMVLNDDGTGVFENADVKFFWYFSDDMLTLHYDVGFGNVTPTVFSLTEENGVKTLTELNVEEAAVFVQQ